MIAIPTRFSTSVEALLLGALAIANAPAIAEEISPSADRIQAHLDFLADDYLEGRETGSAGYEIAARYVASQFRQIGIEPAGDDGYFQRIEFVRMETDPEATHALVQKGDELHEFEYKEDFLVRAHSYTDEVRVTAPLVFVGYGIDAPEEGIDSFGNVDVAGKIAIYISGAPKSLPSEQRAHYSSRSEKRRQLISRGAVGAITIRSLTDRKRYGWERIKQFAGRPSMVWHRGDQRPADRHPDFRTAMVVNPKAAEKIFGLVDVDVADLLEEAEEAIPQSFDLEGVVFTAASSASLTDVSSPNVVGVLPGSDPALADEHVVYSAHLDHIGRGREVDGDDINNGYFDNAMGISIMLEVARVMAESATPPKRSVLFVAVTGEEHGLFGSQYFALFPTVPAQSLVANVNVDMPLLLFPLADLIAFGAEHSSLGAVAEAAAEAHGFTFSPDPMPEEVLFVRSDQYSFVKQGVPAIYLKPGFQSSDPEIDGKALSDEFRKTHYHKPSDQKGLPVDFDSVVRFAAVNATIGSMIANQPQPPAWHEGNFFGEVFGSQ